MKHFKENNFEEALKLLQQALPIKEKCFGENHLKVANTKYFIGLIYKTLKQNDLAITNLGCSLSIYEQKLGS
jgi:tetratricopeptide (TPR) repeat protein